MSVLAIDVGTTMIKSVVFDDQGNELAVARLATEVHRRHAGWAEQDMSAVWNAVVYTVRNALSEIDDPVWLVTFTAQGDGAWLVDKQGKPTGPAILWSDGRAGDILTRWEKEGILEDAFRRNGSLTCSGMPNAIFSWLGSNDPQRLARSAASLTAAGWLFLNLTGVTAMDESDASAPFLNHATGDYDDEIVDMFGLSGYRRLLPRVLGEQERIAEITKEAAGQLGLPEGLPVVMAPYDIASTARGVGVVNPGQACSILGTTLCTEIVRHDIDTTGEPSGINIAYRGRERVLRAFPTLNGADVLNWAAKLLHLEGPPELSKIAFEGSVPGARGLTFLPYLSPAGERAPFLDPRARGTFWGLSLEHTQADIARSVFDGLSLVLRDSLVASRTTVTELRLCGGGANSEEWCQLIADTTGVPTARSGDTELGAKGAFLTALVLSGAESSMHSAAAKYVRMTSTWEPDPERSQYYAGLYESFLEWRTLAREAGWSAANASAAPYVPGPRKAPAQGAPRA
ncbi:FGGY-family carbohydrate kinase [Streptomyces sp. NBC_01304]|uniref:FGGY-family carbohydrate kinase n=1 Tax=Streptomyces sp. NBC_01304 TaxID=2903818 RepID=UPI002E0EBC10|nr:carbohydrate kinase [Streptomyces sp. NBC_01304]